MFTLWIVCDLLKVHKTSYICAYFTFSTVFGWGLFTSRCSLLCYTWWFKMPETKVPLFFLFSLIMMERALGWDRSHLILQKESRDKYTQTPLTKSTSFSVSALHPLPSLLSQKKEHLHVSVKQCFSFIQVPFLDQFS